MLGRLQQRCHPCEEPFATDKQTIADLRRSPTPLCTLMSPSFSKAVEALTAQAQTLIAATSAEVDALREELEQERRFRRHLEANAAARAHEVAAQQEEGRRVRERLEA